MSEVSVAGVDQLGTRTDAASRVISSSCAWAVAAGLIPVPILDMAALAGVQVRMADGIAHLYGQSFRKEVVESTISVLLGTLLPGAAAGAVSSGVKAIPGIGTLLGLVTFPVFAGMSTYAMGRVLVRHFEHGGTASSFTPDAIKQDLQSEFAASKEKHA